MAKPMIKLVHSKENCSLNKIKKTLSENYACYVLLTCDAPTLNGKMNVAMSFDGDETLASFLVENARQVFDNQAGLEKSH